MSIKLPISKSIANRILLLQAIHGDPLMRVSSDMPDDVIVLHDALQKIREVYGVPGSFPSGRDGVGLSLHLKNSGTALRFLEVHIEKCYPGEPITLTGDARLMERKGKPTSQTTSARILHGENIPVEKNESPYITMTRKVVEQYSLPSEEGPGFGLPIERDWSSAAFWYEYVAIHGGELLLEGLTDNSIQGDRIVADIYAEHFGVTTRFVPEGVVIKKGESAENHLVILDFTPYPDLFPSIALTCERLGLTLQAEGTDRLRFKESDRLEAVRLHEVRNDHRMAMALMAADYPVSKKEQACVAKSYPQFVEELQGVTGQTRDHTATTPRPVCTVAHVTPVKGVNDDNLGKKHALSKLIHATDAEYVWLHDDDVVLPKAAKTIVESQALRVMSKDLIILPLRMESEQSSPSLLERLQIAEYAAIQEITMRTAKKDQAIMCSGANLIVKREVWLACEPDLHPEIPSGDDMFLLEAAKRRGYKIGVIDEPDYTAIVRPQTTWRSFLRQRMRWAGKAPHYTDRDIRRYGAIVVAANMAQLLFFPIILVKFPIEYHLIKTREPRTPWYVALLLEIFYPIYMLVAFFGGLLRTKQW